MKRISILSMAPLAIALTACGGGDAPADQADSETVETREATSPTGRASAALDRLGDKKIVVQNQGGSKAGANLDLPDGFPEDISLPSSMNLVSTSTPLPNTQMIMGITPTAPANVIEELRALMSSNGWTESGFQEMTPQMSRIDFEKDDRMANATVTLNGDTSAVQFMTGPKMR